MPIHHALALLLVAACNANVERPHLGDDDAPDAAEPTTDSNAATDARACFGPVCLTTIPETALDGLAGPLDTTQGASCDPSITAYCVVAATDITVPPGSTLAVMGSRPLVLIATGKLAIAGTIDASSHATPQRVAGAGAGAACSAPAAAPSKHGGGAGGSFGGTGGDGAGNSGNDTGGTHAAIAASTAELRAGCRGQDAGTVVESFGVGGDGGGAIYLVAGMTLDVTGSIAASGAAGTGGRCTPAPCKNGSGDDANGGGGGGSGGMIVLDAPAIAIAGSVFADGGGGGEGASHSLDGVAGSEPDGTAPAAGGTGPADHGGNGGAGTHADASSGTAGQPGSGGDPGGGGGGGGGAGVIVLRGATPTVTGTISPPITTIMSSSPGGAP
jgi:hypothetical protein